MQRSRFSESQTVGILREAESEITVRERQVHDVFCDQVTILISCQRRPATHSC